MPNYTTNKLKIRCNNSELMVKIKKLIFLENEKGEKQYSMKKFLPMPEGFSDHPEYSKYGYDWCCTVWGTKWDVCYPKCKESGDTLILLYETAWSPNCEWVEIFSKYLNWCMRIHKNDATQILQVEHDFWELGMGFGGKLNWRPGEEFKYRYSGIMEYAYLFNRVLHDSLVKNLDYMPFIPKNNS
jgi:hypothetical protein